MRKLRIFGDTHGHHDWYKQHVVAANLEYIPTFHVGDFGIGFPHGERWDNYWLEDPDGFARMNGVIAGNHDNPLWVKECPLFLPRYSYLNGIFSMHGAASIDREWRKPGVSWWEREELSDSEMEEAKELYLASRPNVVITHDGPLQALRYMFPMQAMNSHIPPSRTQIFLDDLFEEHKPKFWFFGHWHHTMCIEDFEGCTFQCIGERDWVDFDFEKMEIFDK